MAESSASAAGHPLARGMVPADQVLSAIDEAGCLGLALTDRRGLHVYTNRAYRRVTDMEPGALACCTWHQALSLPGQDADRLEEQLQREHQGAIGLLLSPRGRHAVHGSAVPLRSGGCYQGCLVLLEEGGVASKLAGGRLACPPGEPCESATDLVLSVTPQGRIAYANPAARRLLGRPGAALAGARLADLAWGGWEPQVASLAARLAAGTPLGPREVALKGGDGSRHVFEASALPAFDEGGRLFASVVIARDVTERERVQEATREACEELRQLERMKDNFMAVLSHELKTPLTPLRVYLEVMLAGKAGPLSEQQREYLKICLRRLDDELTLIGNLLDFTRLHQAGAEIQRERLDLGQVVERAIELAGYQARGHGVSIEVRLPGRIDYVGDREKLSQVFINLISNAIKFNRQGGHVLVEGGLLPDGGVAISVTDTGIGVPADKLEQIFEHFYQVDDGMTRKFEGTGIGLSMARSLVRLHGGNIVVRSRVDEGSVFTVVLPAHNAEREH